MAMPTWCYTKATGPTVLVTITNTGQLPGPDQRGRHTQAGLKLINSLLPRSGARLDHQQVGTQVVTTLLVQAPSSTSPRTVYCDCFTDSDDFQALTPG